MTLLHLAALAAAAMAPSPDAPAVKLWRLDCGGFEIKDFASFSDTARYDGQARTLVDSCYLIQHGADYVLWDTGLDGALAGKTVDAGGGYTLSLKATIATQLAAIGVRPDQVRYVGISHYHDDHTGQVGAFPAATLLIGAADLEAIKAGKTYDPAATRKSFAPWLQGGAKAEPVTGDKDVFGDGSVVMLGLPGHTPGHHALLVRLKGMGPVLLSGDQFHQRESFDHDQVPTFNISRADTLASIARFKELASTLHATVIIQHEAADVAKLPSFPEYAR